MSAESRLFLMSLLAAMLAGCTGSVVLSPVAVIWEDVVPADAGRHQEHFEAECHRCQGEVRSEALAQDFESPVRRTSGAERYARARAWGRGALAACLADAHFAVRIAPVSEAPAPERVCSVDGVIYP